MSESHTIRCEVQYSGRVQGVGFRWNACNIARDFPVTGFVRNLPDGCVQLIAEGEREVVERFLAAIAASMSRNIQRAESVITPPTGEFTSFATVR